jgi:hypothetical protein
MNFRSQLLMSSTRSTGLKGRTFAPATAGRQGQDFPFSYHVDLIKKAARDATTKHR